MTDTSLIRRIRALLAKGEGTTGPEADAFLTKARDLMHRHQLSMGDLRDAEDPLGLGEDGLLIPDPQWCLLVASAVAEYFDCVALIHQDVRPGLSGVALVGRESARVTARHMIGHCLMQVQRESSALMRSVVGDLLWSVLHDTSHASPDEVASLEAVQIIAGRYDEAVGHALVRRIQTLLDRGAPSDGSTDRALVPLSEARAMAEQYSDSTELVSVKVSQAAMAAAERIGLDVQVNRSEGSVDLQITESR